REVTGRGRYRAWDPV
ncbi:helix-turn-helix domain-containing protein, partial [Mesorhizobium sp. M7A.F.Ca.CA.002.05.1.1]